MMLEPDLSKNRQTSELYFKCVPTLKKRSEFLRLRSGKRCSTKTLVLQSSMTATQEYATAPRVGYTVTKKVGNSVIRNRIRRRLREAVKQVFPLKSKSNHDYVIIGKYAALTHSFTTILKDLEQALDHVHRNKAKGIKNLVKKGDAAKNISHKKRDTQ